MATGGAVPERGLMIADDEDVGWRQIRITRNRGDRAEEVAPQVRQVAYRAVVDGRRHCGAAQPVTGRGLVGNMRVQREEVDEFLLVRIGLECGIYDACDFRIA